MLPRLISPRFSSDAKIHFALILSRSPGLQPKGAYGDRDSDVSAKCAFRVIFVVYCSEFFSELPFWQQAGGVLLNNSWGRSVGLPVSRDCGLSFRGRSAFFGQ